jgi:hypothetical protein
MPSTIQHVARWWLAEPLNDTTLTRFRTAVAPLRTLPGVLSLRFGTSSTVTWTGPDQSWDLGFVVSFESMDAVTGYMEHPLHHEVVALARELTTRIDAFYLDVSSSDTFENPTKD